MDTQTLAPARTHTVADDVWDPNAQSTRENCTIIGIHQKGSDGFWYGYVPLDEVEETIEVYWSPFRRRWSGPVCH